MAYARLPAAAELENTGFTVADYEETAEVWPENWPVFEVFALMGTQWRHGPAGPVGLDYPTLWQLLDRQGFAGDEWHQAFADVRQMEDAALAALRTKP